MTLARPEFRRAWIALAVVLGALSGSRGASAACAATAMRDGGACPPACACCETPTPSAAGSRAVAPAPASRADAPGCVCRAESPSAPDPTPKSGETRPATDQARDAGGGWTLFEAAPGPGRAAVGAPAGPRPKLPTYLRTSRLLI